MLRQFKNYFHLLEAVAASFIFRFPSRKLRVIAITGTDGKTTTSTLVYHILNSAGKKVALISTVAAFIGEAQIDTGFHVTNPSPFALQKLIRRAVREKVEFLVLEVTSHGIDQYRNWGIEPELAAITNVTHEHLDYHKTFANYLDTKAKLLLSAKHAYINMDASESYELLKAKLTAAKVNFESVGVSGLTPKLSRVVKKRFGSELYNFENVALASRMAMSLGIDEKAILKAIATFKGVKGRMESVENKRGLHIIVDFAHTPNALERAIQAVSQKNKSAGSKLTVVFGCAGLRDVTKRPIMGSIAAKLADLAVFTAEDPRSEDVFTIINQMKSGIEIGHDKVVSIADRYKAIEFAINNSKSGDFVLITGKGHEQSMNFKGVEYNWNDVEAVQKILKS